LVSTGIKGHDVGHDVEHDVPRRDATTSDSTGKRSRLRVESTPIGRAGDLR
jgi:hypothetical protein